MNEEKKYEDKLELPEMSRFIICSVFFFLVVSVK
jgi:hypothetical protein